MCVGHAQQNKHTTDFPQQAMFICWTAFAVLRAELSSRKQTTKRSKGILQESLSQGEVESISKISASIHADFVVVPKTSRSFPFPGSDVGIKCQQYQCVKHEVRFQVLGKCTEYTHAHLCEALRQSLCLGWEPVLRAQVQPGTRGKRFQTQSLEGKYSCEVAHSFSAGFVGSCGTTSVHQICAKGAHFPGTQTFFFCFRHHMKIVTTGLQSVVSTMNSPLYQFAAFHL